MDFIQPVISIIIPIISLVTSVVTLLLTRFNGPDITLLNQPKFQITDDEFFRGGSENTPTWFESDLVTLIFSNYGGNAGTILDLQLDFHPDKALTDFVKTTNQRIQQQLIDEPLILLDGENEPIDFRIMFRMIDWKKAALVESLNSQLSISQIIEQASIVSQSKYLQFCEALDNLKNIGSVSCSITLTKGRFRTQVVQETLFEHVIVVNSLDTLVPTLRTFVERWDTLYHTNSQLLQDLRNSVGDIITDNQTNLSTLNAPVTEETLNTSRLRTEAWKRINNPNISLNDQKIRWFLIDSESGLREEVSMLYRGIERFNSQVNYMLTLGDFRQDSHYEKINTERTELIRQIKSVSERLLALGPKME